MKAKNIGEFRHYEFCRFCGLKTTPVLDLGYMPLAGGFLKTPKLIDKEKFYPLMLTFCKNCFLLQTSDVIDKDILFQNYFYKTSAIQTLVQHFEKIGDELVKSFNGTRKIKVLEIGCNDGSFLKYLLKVGFDAYGVDPATNIVSSLTPKLPIHNDYFGLKTAQKIKRDKGTYDIICSFNTLAHIEDMHEIFKSIKLLLKSNGILVFENQYLGTLIKSNLYDTIYHEHQYYYSALTIRNFIKQFDMEIFDIVFSNIHGGSIRFYIQNKNTGIHKIQKRIKNIFANELKNKFDQIYTYRLLAKRIKRQRKQLISIVKKLIKDGKTIAGYGASGRGTIIMNYCGFDSNTLDYVIDDAPAKIHSYTPGNHLPIVPSSILMTDKKTDYIILFAWTFRDEIEEKCRLYKQNGGKFILPLPKVTIV